MSSHTTRKRKFGHKNRENKRQHRIVGLPFLPPEILSEIVSHLGLVDIVNAYSSCKDLRDVMLINKNLPAT